MKGCLGFSVVIAMFLAGCATPRAEQLLPEAQGLYGARTALTDASPQIDQGASGRGLPELLAQPVDADAAVRIALVNNARVTALYARIGIAAADLYDSARLSNPVLGYTRLVGGSEASKVDWSLSQNFTELLFLRFRRAGADSRALLAKQQVARELLSLEAEVRAADVRFIGSRTVAALRERVAQTTQVAAAYAQQLFDAGNISTLQIARMNEAAAVAAASALRAEASEVADRNALLTAMGLTSDASVGFVGDYQSPLPDELKAEEVSRWAGSNRLDLLSAREALRFATIAQAHAKRWRWFGDSSIGIARERDGSNAGVPNEALTGPSASIALPIFNRGRGSVVRANSEVEQLSAEVRSLEIAITNDVSSRIASLEAARKAVIQYREQILPTQKLIVEESQKQQNYMLIGALDLLTARQHQIEGYEAYIDALRDYWLARVELLRATGGRYPGLVRTPGGQAIAPFPYTTPAQGENP